MFESDANLFFEAETYVLDASEKFEQTKTLLTTMKDEMEQYGYDHSHLDNNQDKIDSVDTSLKGLIENITKVRDSLKQIDEAFANAYSGILSNYGVEDVTQYDNSPLTFGDGELDFMSLTDLQYHKFAMLSYYFVNKTNIFEENKGKTLKEIEDLICDGKGFSKNGIADFTIYDVHLDAYGNASVLVLLDEMGNYTLVFPCTYNPGSDPNKDTIQQYEDVVYDVETFFDIEGLYGAALEKIIVSSATAFYYEKAREEGKQLNFFGYSKGGGVAEYAYVSLAKFLTEEERTTLGDIVVYNPLHENLTTTEVNILKESEDLTVYRNQGDLVSTYNHENTFDDETIFIHCDWANLYNASAPKEYSGIAEFGMTFLDPDIAMLIKNKDNFGYLFSGGPHSVGAAHDTLAFDDYGNSIYNPESYLYTESGKYSGREVSMYLMGTENIKWWTDEGDKWDFLY